jgi:hypothetical protein
LHVHLNLDSQSQGFRFFGFLVIIVSEQDKTKL